MDKRTQLLKEIRRLAPIAEVDTDCCDACHYSDPSAFLSWEDIARASERKSSPYPILGILQDGEIVENGMVGGNYVGVGIFLKNTTYLEQDESLIDYLSRIFLPQPNDPNY